MSEQTGVTLGDIRALIGKTKEEVLEIDRSLVRNFCQALGDTNPKWNETAPPGFLTTAMMSGGSLAMGIPVPYKRNVAAGADWHFLKPIKIGDVITTIHKFADVQDKSSEKGLRVLLLYESTHHNQNGELVAISINSIMSY